MTIRKRASKPGPTIEVTWDGAGRAHRKSQRVFVVVRHTRSGDKRVAVVSGDDADAAQARAMEIAEDTATRAAQDYGHGSASVFRGRLIVEDDAIPG